MARQASTFASAASCIILMSAALGAFDPWVYQNLLCLSDGCKDHHSLCCLLALLGVQALLFC